MHTHVHMCMQMQKAVPQMHAGRYAGANSMRISIEWSRLFPERGRLDDAAVKRYHQMFDCMDQYIPPNVYAFCP